MWVVVPRLMPAVWWVSGWFRAVPERGGTIMEQDVSDENADVVDHGEYTGLRRLL